MYHIDFERPCHVHFIGIGGISMSGLAEILLERGFTVSGSDARESELTKKLEAHGAKLFYGQKAENIMEGTDVVVYTAAVHPDNPEYAAAAGRSIPILTRAELLGQIMRNYNQSDAVAGTHGKTTTTSMLTGDPDGGTEGPHHFRRGDAGRHRRQYPCGRPGDVRDRGL